MQLRCLHATAATFAVQNHDPEGDDGPTIDVAGSIVALVAAERGDADAVGRVAAAAADHISGMADQLGEQTVVLVPFADLTDAPASEATATAALDALADRLDGERHRVPVGEHVAVDLQARGHPHASQGFEIALPDRTDGEWLVLDEGALVPAAGHRLLADGRLVDRCADDRLWLDGGPPLADDGTLLPLGTFVRDSLVEFVAERFQSTGAFPVDSDSATLDPREFVSDAADFPVALSTTTDSLELATAVQPGGALDGFTRHLDLLVDLLGDLGLDAHPVCRLDADFFEANRDLVTDLDERFDDSMLVERRSDADTPLRLELLVCDDGYRLAEPTVWLDKAEANPVVRSRIEDPLRLTAAVARCAADRDTPQLPTWLSPTQLRLIPLTDDDIERCVAIAEDLPSVRVDIDDRDSPVSERLGDASQQWIPYDAVIGEGDEKRFGVTIRAEEREREFTTDSVAQCIDCETAGFPDRPRPLSLRYTDCPSMFRAREE